MLEINNLTRTQVDNGFLKKTASLVLDKEKAKDKDISLAFVGQERIQELNNKYRGKNKATDILTFSDEIVICLSQVKKNAKTYGFTFKKELTRALIHGLLHVLGYDHEKTKKEAQAMQRKEEEYLAIL